MDSDFGSILVKGGLIIVAMIATVILMGLAVFAGIKMLTGGSLFGATLLLLALL